MEEAVPDPSEARDRDETIPRAVMASIAARPEALAVVEPERRVTYGELGELVRKSNYRGVSST